MSQAPAFQRTLEQLHALCVPGKIFECHCRWKWCPNCSYRTTHFRPESGTMKEARSVLRKFWCSGRCSDEKYYFWPYQALPGLTGLDESKASRQPRVEG